MLKVVFHCLRRPAHALINNRQQYTIHHRHLTHGWGTNRLLDASRTGSKSSHNVGRLVSRVLESVTAASRYSATELSEQIFRRATIADCS